MDTISPNKIDGRGLSGICGDWPTDDSIESIVDRIKKSIMVTRCYIDQFNKYKQGE